MAAHGHLLAKSALKLVTEKSPIMIGSLCDHTNGGFCVISDFKHREFAREYGYIHKSPILVSDSEPIEKEDLVYHKKLGIGECCQISQVSAAVVFKDYDYARDEAYPYHNIDPHKLQKVLADPSMFDLDLLHRIAEGEIKEGETVFLKACVDFFNFKTLFTGDPLIRVHLNKKGKLTLFNQ